MKYPVGSRRRVVTLQQPVYASGSTGGDITSWTTVSDGIWAAIVPLSGREFFATAQSLESKEISHRIGIRYRSGLRPDMRIVYGTRYFDIKSVINIDERNEELELICIERVNP